MVETLQALAPETVLLLLASVMYVAGTFVATARWSWMSVTLGALALAGLTMAVCSAPDLPASAVIATDMLAAVGRVLALITGAALVLLSSGMDREEKAAEYFASLLLVVVGSMLVARANELILLFLGLELISIPTYVMLYLPRSDEAVQESAAKYFFLSIFSSSLFLYGLSFVYGAAGSTSLAAVARATAELPAPAPATLLVALALIMAGLGFKMAAAPFHFYAPDVYEGTSNTLAALLAWVPKAAGVLAIIRLVNVGVPGLAEPMAWMAWVLAAATMTTGNLLGLLQDNLRRLFAYSGIAHAGTMLIGLGVGTAGGASFLTTTGSGSVMFYLLAYAAMTLGAFAVIVYLSSPTRPVETVDDLAGLARTNPVVALAMAVFLFSLTGIPLTGGFWAKLAVFSSAIGSATASGDARYIWLTAIAVVNVAISSYYYLRIVGVMYMQPSYSRVAPGGGRPALVVTAACLVATLGLGVLPSPFLQFLRDAEPPTVTSRSDRGSELQQISDLGPGSRLPQSVVQEAAD